MMRECNKCKCLLDDDKFYRCRKTNNPMSPCKECRGVLSRDWHRQNPKQQTPTERRKLIDANLKQWLLRTAKCRAKKKGVECTITTNDFEIPDKCPILGVTLVRGVGKALGSSPSLDRIDPTKGYIPGNVAVISYRANTLKSFGTIEEHQAVVDYMKGASSYDT